MPQVRVTQWTGLRPPHTHLLQLQLDDLLLEGVAFVLCASCWPFMLSYWALKRRAGDQPGSIWPRGPLASLSHKTPATS